MVKQSSLSSSTWARQPSMTNLCRPLSFNDLRETSRQGPEADLSSHTKRNSHRVRSNQTYTTKFLWVRGHLLGEGSYGRVFIALNANTGELMAVKQVGIKGSHKPAHQDALRFLAFENETLRELDHPNVVKYLGYEASSETLSLFLEYVPGGTIATLLSQHGRFREEVTKFFTKQILDGLGYLHSRSILHRDLKPDNILVDPTGVCKISDFGISKHVGDMYKAGKHTLMKGTIHYMAPEILGSIGGIYDGKIDIWSVGCMIMEMWSGEKPWGADTIWVVIMQKLLVQTPPPLAAKLVEELSPDAHSFRESCFWIDPIQRPSAVELKNHSYLRLPHYWNFSTNGISHPSGEKRIGLSSYKQDNYDDETTSRPSGNNRDSTLRPQNDHQKTGNSAPVPKIPRGLSPPIVVIKPIPPRALSPSSVEFSGQDRTTSGSSTSPRQKSSPGRRRYEYYVANPEDDGVPAVGTPNYQFVPSPLPQAPSYSAFLAPSSKHNTNCMPDSVPQTNPSHSTPHLAPTPPASSDVPYFHPSNVSLSSSSSSSSLLQPPSGMDDSTWKRLPVVARPHSSNATLSSSFSHKQNSSSSFRGYHRQPIQLQMPLASDVPPPTLPTRVPCAQPSPIVPGMMEGLPTQLALGRPNVDDVVRHLGTYFPDHDLDQLAIVPSPSIHLTERPTTPYRYGDLASTADNETAPGPSTPYQHRLIDEQFSLPHTTVRRERLVDSGNLRVSSHHTDHQRGGIAAAALHRNVDRPERTKSSRQLAEEWQFNPDKAHRHAL